MTPMKAIRQKCLECSCGSSTKVKECKVTKCPLYEFRLGKNPNRKNLTDEERQILRERALKNLVNKKSKEN